MVKGLEIFREHFKNCAHQYALIGGTACDLAMEEAGLGFRATKDLDMVLCIEVIDPAFLRTFWDFIRLGKYQIQEHSTNKPQYFRFMQPGNTKFPSIIELFTRRPDAFPLTEGNRFVPITADEGASSLSAILMDDAYYQFLNDGKKQVNGITIVDPEHLIPLKAKAWLDLIARQRQGNSIDSIDIRKHKNDIFRLYQIIQPDFHADIPPSIRNDMGRFLDAMATEAIDLTNFGYGNAIKPETILGELRRIYCTLS
jgi:hypothetical protein